MINYLKVDNYSCFVNFRIDFSSINVILGGNGTGKSTLFELLAGLRCFIQGKETVADVFPFSSLTRWQTVPVQTFELSLSYKSFEYVYKLEIEFNIDERKNKIKKEIVLCNGKPIFKAEDGKAILYSDSYEPGPELLMNWSVSGVSLIYERLDNKLLCDFKRSIDNVIVCHPLPFEHVTSDAYYENDFVDDYADNITESYHSVMQSNPEKIMGLWKVMKDINPAFVRTHLQGDPNKILFFEYDHNGKKISYKIDELSDGEKMLFKLYFLAVMYYGEDCSLFLDEPDNYISLQEVGQFVQYIQDESDSKKQCALISHHPSVIDNLAASNGIWLERRSYGASVICDPPKADCGLTYSEILMNGGSDEAK